MYFGAAEWRDELPFSPALFIRRREQKLWFPLPLGEVQGEGWSDGFIPEFSQCRVLNPRANAGLQQR